MLDQLNNIDFSSLKDSKRGIERETLRVTNKGQITKTAHPKGLGEKLTNESITVDFSEELLEFITPPFKNQSECFNRLHDITAFTLQNMDNDELIWSSSMPPTATENEITIANFGTNNSAKMKQVYRHGLANRYNKIMQVISGIHYNFSPSEAFLKNLPCCPNTSLTERKNNLYFRLINKFHRSSWALSYLFGASPICAKSSVIDKPDYLTALDSNDYIGEYATSLRMSDLGYQSDAQESLFISCQNINKYVVDLLKATYTGYPKYIEMGIQDKNGQYLQLNDCILQIENEYYSTIRPKQIAHMGERPACALLRRGVEYVEVRLLDIDPFDPIGISQETANFVEVFLITAMLSDQDYYSDEAMKEARKNFGLVTKQGRKPGLKLSRHNNSVTLHDWLEIILNDCLSVANKIDIACNTQQFSSSVKAQILKLKDSSLTKSAQVIQCVNDSGSSYQDWMLDMSKSHSTLLRDHKIEKNILNNLKQESKDSLKKWEYLENQHKNEGSFADYIKSYYDKIC
ncbi:glutamate--cysteine ligase [Francisellaceae bacterium]|nr:glutamate--cysteine ligase [Francisellaceae bacterium]